MADPSLEGGSELRLVADYSVIGPTRKRMGGDAEKAQPSATIRNSGPIAHPWSARLLDGEKREKAESVRITAGEQAALRELVRRCDASVSKIFRLGLHAVLAAAEQADPDREEPDALLDTLADLVTSPVKLVEALEPMLRAGVWADAARADPAVTFARFAPLSQKEVA